MRGSEQFSHHPKCEDLGINAIYPSDQFVQIVSSAFLEFHEYSGLQANNNKTRVYIARIDDQINENQCPILGF